MNLKGKIASLIYALVLLESSLPGATHLRFAFGIWGWRKGEVRHSQPELFSLARWQAA